MICLNFQDNFEITNSIVMQFFPLDIFFVEMFNMYIDFYINILNNDIMCCIQGGGGLISIAI